MAEKWHVRATRAVNGLVHPVDGPIAEQADDQGVWSMWTPDQFTFRLISDGAIERVEKAQTQKSDGRKSAAKESPQ